MAIKGRFYLRPLLNLTSALCCRREFRARARRAVTPKGKDSPPTISSSGFYTPPVSHRAGPECQPEEAVFLLAIAMPCSIQGVTLFDMSSSPSLVEFKPPVVFESIKRIDPGIKHDLYALAERQRLGTSSDVMATILPTIEARGESCGHGGRLISATTVVNRLRNGEPKKGSSSTIQLIDKLFSMPPIFSLVRVSCNSYGYFS